MRKVGCVSFNEYHMNATDFKTSSYFSPLMVFFGVFLLFSSFLLITLDFSWIALLLVLPAVVILTSHYRFRINWKEKTYHDYIWVLGMKIGDKGTFQTIEYLFIKSNKVHQTMHLRVASSTVFKEVVDAYIRLSPEKKIHLFTRESRHDALVRLREVADLLHVRVVDYTTTEALTGKNNS